jgi:hypothetical protein
MACSLSKLDRSIRSGFNGQELEREMAIVKHVCALGGAEIDEALRGLRHHHDESMVKAAKASLDHIATLPNSDYVLPDRTPDMSARGTGRKPDQTHIPQFGSGSTVSAGDVPV